MYAITDDAVTWKGKRLKGVSPDGFQVLSPILARHGATLYILGKAARIDATGFEILSDGYARDADTVYLIMETKLKPVKAADAASFIALGSNHGRDATTAFCRDKRMRLAKGAAPADLRPLGHIFATDGQRLYFNTQAVTPPEGADLSARGLRLRWFDDGEINMPRTVLSDGAGVWIYLPTGPVRWAFCDGADFDTLTPLGDEQTLPWRVPYMRDAASVWYQGQIVDGADPATASMSGAILLTDGPRVWLGARLLDMPASEVAYVDRSHLRDEVLHHGALLHHGTHLAFHGEDGLTKTLATAQPATERPSLNDILRALFTSMSTLFTHYPPLVWRVGDALSHMTETAPEPAELPEFTARLTPEGALALDLACGTTLQQPAACWYTLGCHLWAHVTGRPLSFLPYPPLGTMLPRSTEAHTALIRAHRAGFHALIGHLFDAGHTDQADILAHYALGLARRQREVTEDDFQDIANLPRRVIHQLHYRAAHYRFEVTTNLAVSRLIVGDGWLDAPDIRDRIDVLSTLHGALLSTNKTALFFKEILPPVMARYADEPDAAVREHLAMVLEAALIKGQVTAEVSREMHHAAMRPVIEFCIANGLNTVINRARLVETLWALDRDAEAEEVAERLISEIGEDAHLPGVYTNRLIYRTPRLWFLRGRLDISWRKAPSRDAHNARLAALESEYDALRDRYGPHSADWPEMTEIRDSIDRYRAAIAST